ncbi:ATP-binding protein [Arthrobacter sp. 35W]|uniref:ATP-binding protein n=1 Tax=Arthrobacter sp. 35W TaxID=1132441 RepID=UPI0003FC7AB5|nr:ATP-binding protein [Arthrobacter sp. 35W]
MKAQAAGAGKDIEYYARALRAPRIGDGYRPLANTAREAGWTHEEYLAAVLSREVAEREASGSALRIKAARFPGHKMLEDFNFEHQPAADRSLIAHLGTGVFGLLRSFRTAD